MQSDSPDLRHGNWGQNLVQSFLSACWPTEPLALTPSLLHSVLLHEPAVNTDEICIWAVCFSPDSKLLATAAEDKVIRVSPRTLMLAIVIVIIIFGRST